MGKQKVRDRVEGWGWGWDLACGVVVRVRARVKVRVSARQDVTHPSVSDHRGVVGDQPRGLAGRVDDVHVGAR